jgi:SAM-dependent methyltransferase
MPVVEQMLELGAPTAEDSLYDLGSGDGRIVVEAAETFGTPGVGVEIDSSRVAMARNNAREAGVEDLVRFVRGDLFEVDVSPATVVTLYLLTSVNLELRPKLFRELRPGTRVVSHDFDMGEWAADSVVSMPEENSTVYFWVMPARVQGRWIFRLPGGASIGVEIDQKFQELRAEAVEGGASVDAARVEGDSVRFTLTGVEGAPGGSLVLEGTASDGRMSGTAAGGAAWSAERTAGADGPVDAWKEAGAKR